MAKTKKTKKSTKKQVSSKTLQSMVDVTPEVSYSDQQRDVMKPPMSKINLLGGVILFIVVIGVILLFRNGLIVSAMVNGKPMFSWTLYSSLMRRFGKQTLEGLITERLIADEAQRADVKVTDEDVKVREDQILANIGGQVSLDELLQYQGMTKEDFDTQIRLQLTVEKVAGKGIAVGDGEVDQFLATSSARLNATDPAELREEAKRMIFEERLGLTLATWFNDLKKNARITRFVQ